MRYFGIQKAFVWTQILSGSVPYTAKASHAEYQQSPIWGKIVTHMSIPSFVGYWPSASWAGFLKWYCPGDKVGDFSFPPKVKTLTCHGQNVPIWSYMLDEKAVQGNLLAFSKRLPGPLLGLSIMVRPLSKHGRPPTVHGPGCDLIKGCWPPLATMATVAHYGHHHQFSPNPSSSCSRTAAARKRKYRGFSLQQLQL